MIYRSEIDAMAEHLDVPPSFVQRDYVNGWLLHALYGSSHLARRLVLKGGNCLRKAYFETGRYSGDLDFSCSSALPNEQFRRELNNLCSFVAERAGVQFDLSRTRVEDKRDLDGGKHLSEARLYFRDFYGAETQRMLRVKLDVAQFDRLYLPPDTRPLIHPYSDAAACAINVRCVCVEEVLATKLRCLLQRRHIADLFDLVHGTMSPHASQLDLARLVYVFFRITVFGGYPRVAKGLFVDLPFAILGEFWRKHITCPKVARISFERAQEAFTALVERLLPGDPQRTRSSKFFASSLRGPIMNAADTMTLLRIRYKGIERLAEPYELAFKVREDGIGREYLYLYDRTGGRSGPGLKTFVSEHVQAIESTDHVFEPRYPVELRKAGGSETVSRFSRRQRSP
jgi:predicted nucleotidyltransferase component of viral defense system